MFHQWQIISQQESTPRLGRRKKSRNRNNYHRFTFQPDFCKGRVKLLLFASSLSFTQASFFFFLTDSRSKPFLENKRNQALGALH